MNPDVKLKLFVISIYLVILVIIALLSRRAVSDTVSDYVLAGRGLGTVVLTFTMLASMISAFSFLGYTGYLYNAGMGVYLAIGLSTTTGSFLFYYVGRRMMLAARKFDFITPSDFFEDRLNSKGAGLVYTLISFIFMAPYFGMQVMAGGITIDAMTHGTINYLTATTIFAAIIVAYVLMGGMLAVAWTDFVQGVVMLTGLVALVFGILYSAGGVGALGGRLAEIEQAIMQIPGPGGEWTPRYLITYQFVIWGTIIAQPWMIQRYYAAESSKTLKQSMLLWPVLLLGMYFLNTIIGLSGKVFVGDLEGGFDALTPIMADMFLPGPLAAILIAGGLAAIMSTSDSLLLTVGSIFTRDVYKKYVNQNISASQEANIGKVFILVIAAIGFIIALHPPGFIVAMATWAFSGITSVTPVILAALYWKRITPTGGFVGMLLCAGITIGFLSNILPNAWTLGMMPGMIAWVIGTAAMIIVSYITPPMPEEIVQKYYDDLWEKDAVKKKGINTTTVNA